jgi:hypothetical protein
MTMIQTESIQPDSRLSRLTIERLLVAIVFISVFTMATRAPADSDTWWHVRAGQYIVETRSIPTTDPFSFTRQGRLWIDHGWLAQIYWYGLFALGGWSLVSLGLATMVTVSFWFVWQQMEGNLYSRGFILVLGAITSSVVWAARPQVVSFLLAAVVAYLLDRFKRHQGRLLPWLPLIVLLWVNVHGGYAIAFILMISYAAGEALNNLTAHQEDPVVDWRRLRHLLLTMGLCLLVVGLNPHTWRMWLYPFQTVGIGVLRDFIQEWQSPNFHQPIAQPFALMLLLILVAMARTNRPVDWTDLALVGGWAVMALFAGRNIAIFALVTTPILARYADEAWIMQRWRWNRRGAPWLQKILTTLTSPRDQPTLRIFILNWVLLAVVFLAALLKVTQVILPQTFTQVEQETMPFAAVAFLQNERPPGPLFNNYNWGGYLIYHLWPTYQVYVDGRTDLYDNEFLGEYLNTARTGDGWRESLERDGINLVLMEHNSFLANALREKPGWQEIFRDEQASVFRRLDASRGD